MERERIKLTALVPVPVWTGRTCGTLRHVILNWLCHQEHMVAQESVVSQSERQEKKKEE